MKMTKVESIDSSSTNGAAPSPQFKCRATLQPDGGISVDLLIEPMIAKRIISRAGGMDVSRYLWENILNRAITDHVY